MADLTPIKNIYQRMIEVQKAVQTVEKKETVKMSENDKGYKATSHDDVAALLHLPLAEAGIVLLPDIESYSTTEFQVEKKGYQNNPPTIQRWYRTDIKIICKWINADKPDDFIQSTGAAFALDTSDKSFAKAYSLAMKIVLLKVHLLESRDGEEQRPFDDENNAPKNAPKPKDKPSEAKKEPPAKPPEKHPRDFIMPTGEGVKGKKLAEIPVATLKKILAWAETEVVAKKGNAAAIKELLEITTNVKAMIPPDKPPQGPGPAKTDPFPPDDVQKHPPVENESQVRGAKPPKADPADFVIDRDIGDLDDIKGKALKQIPEATLKKIVIEIDASIKRTPPPDHVSQLFDISQAVKMFLKSVGVTV